jgi:hypothetical protein
MREPDNHSVLVSGTGTTWVRFDKAPDASGTWWPLVPKPGGVRWPRVGTAHTWDEIEPGEGPFIESAPDFAVEALELVRRAAS